MPTVIYTNDNIVKRVNQAITNSGQGQKSGSIAPMFSHQEGSALLRRIFPLQYPFSNVKFADEHAKTPNDKHGLNEYLENEVLSTGAERIFNTLFVMAACQLEHSRRPLIEDGMQGYLRGLLEKFMGTSFGIFYLMNKADI